MVTKLFLGGRKLNISLAFISQSYFKVVKTITLKATYYFIIKLPSQREPQQIASNHLSDTKFKDFMNLYKDYSKKVFLSLVKDTTLLSDNPLRFKKKLL